MSIPSRTESLKVIEPIEPFHWQKHNITVIDDGYFEDGTRTHQVSERLDSEPVIIANAYVSAKTIKSV